MVSLLKSIRRNNDDDNDNSHKGSGLFKKLKDKAIHRSHAKEQSPPAKSGSTTTKTKPKPGRLRTSTVSIQNVRKSGRWSSSPSPVIPVARARSPSSALPIPRRDSRISTSLSSTAYRNDFSMHSSFRRERVVTANAASSSPRVGLPSIDDYKPKHQKMTYNPYGLGSMNGPSRISTASSARNASFSVDSFDDEVNILPYPVDSPNSHLPEELQANHESLFEEYQFPKDDKSNIGTGASALVKKVVRIGHPRELYALKKFVLFKNEKPQDFYHRAAKEFIIHHNLNAGIHVVTCRSLVKIPHERNLTRGWGLILELCKLDLFDVISKPGFAHVSIGEKMCLFKQVAYGVKYIHECDIVHRDLKPENILLTADGIVKITDFGVADYGHKTPGDFNSDLNMSTVLVGSPPYQPPEVEALKGVARDKRVPYDPFQMDHWALGIILFVLFYGNVPFNNCDKKSGTYRDYVEMLKEYTSRTRKEFLTASNKGPGMEYKFARKFVDVGVARIAWRLVDPNPKTRYRLYDLFADKTFQRAEMCVHENDHACNFCHYPEFTNETFKFSYGSDISKVKTPGSRSSSTSSLLSTPGRSRRNTGSSTTPGSLSGTPVPKVKSMIEIAVEAQHSETEKVSVPPKVDEIDEINEKDQVNEKNNKNESTKEDGDEKVKVQPQPLNIQKRPVEGPKTARSLLHSALSSNSSSPLSSPVADVAQPKEEFQDVLYTSKGIREFKHSDRVQDNIRPISFELAKISGDCRVKYHAHLPRW